MRWRADAYSYREAIEFTAIHINGIEWHWRYQVLRLRRTIDELLRESFSERCLDLWHKIRSEPTARRRTELAQWYHERLMASGTMEEVDQLRYEYQNQLDRLSRLSRRQRRYVDPPTFVGVDFANGPDFTTLTLLEGIRTSALRASYVERANQLTSFEYTPFDSPRQARAGDRAERRALKLLKEWLTPAQLAQYEQHRYFEVTGCHSGARFRIMHGTQMNILEFDGDGRKVCGWCFLPEGRLVAGDVMLAQKIALETDERAALKIANRIASMGDQAWAGGRSGGVVWPVHMDAVIDLAGGISFGP